MPKSSVKEVESTEGLDVSERACVVVLDDDESFRESVCGLLKVCGYRVLAFTSAEELLASDAWHGADCLLADVCLPGSSGPELQRKLRLVGSDIPIIFATGYTDAELETQLLTEGAAACLGKPFEEEELLGSLNTVLTKREHHR